MCWSWSALTHQSVMSDSSVHRAIILRLLWTEFWIEKRVDFWKLINNIITFIYWRVERDLKCHSIWIFWCYEYYYFYSKTWHINSREWRCDSTLHYSTTCSLFKSMASFFFYYLGFLSRTFPNHKTAGEWGGHFFHSSLPHPPTSQTIRI